MKKISKKKLLLLPIIAIFGILLCIINVKNDTFTTLTSSIRHFFEGNDQELIEEKAKESGFEDVNLYTSVIDSYNLFKEDINIIPPTDKVRGEMTYLGGFSREVNVENDIVSFTDGEVKFYEADETVGRMSAANRVGLKITAPETLTYEEYKNAKIIRINTYEDKTQINEMIFDNVKDSETYYETWPVVTSTLKQVTILINWTGTDYQVFTMYFNNVTLEKNEEPTPSVTQDKVRGEMSYLGGFSR
ncbi:MAG TPA: hypothetical protein DCE23_05720, partial [Firmicutes bacterium]|nr:hypothetical protein [Bacillota bacterium]